MTFLTDVSPLTSPTSCPTGYVRKSALRARSTLVLPSLHHNIICRGGGNTGGAPGLSHASLNALRRVRAVFPVTVLVWIESFAPAAIIFALISGVERHCLPTRTRHFSNTTSH